MVTPSPARLKPAARRGRPRRAVAPEGDPAQAPASAFSADTAARLAADLLAWYDRHRRDLPWRARPGETPDPYRVWLSEIMLQQTNVQTVRPYFARFLDRFPTVSDLAAAPSEAVMTAWAGLGYYSRARNLHACAKAVIDQHGGRFPDTEAGLRALPGIGAYTSGAIAAIAFDRRAAAADGNVERVMTRLLAIETPLPAAKPAIREATLALVPDARPGDFAQALMDLGATICTPRRPACALCPWREPCRARARADAETFPRKTAKAPIPARRGAAYLAWRADGALLLRTRPASGLLGGMAEVPTTGWSAATDAPGDERDAPMPGAWRRLNASVRHVFSHFALDLTLYAARFPAGTPAPQGCRWTSIERLGEEPLPNVMRKVVEAGLGEMERDRG